MGSNYKKLGDFIEPVNRRNTDLKVETLLGVSVQKIFIPSIANTVGTNFKNYKIVRKNQFVYIADTSRRGDKIGLAMLEEYDEALVSQAYTVFEIIDKKELDPEYLMMWFRRPEFDRYARYKSHGSVREIFDWEEMCEVELPIPSIEKQREIVNEYNTVTNRIKLNEQLNQKLEETAQALYRHWFVDKKDENWETVKLGDIVIGNPENLSKEDKFKTILYLDTSNITTNKIDEFQELNLTTDKIPSRAKRKVKNNDIVFSTVRPALKHFGIIKNKPENLIVSTGFAVLRLKNEDLFSELVYSFLTDTKVLEALQAKAEMSVSTYPSITIDDILNLDFVMPNAETLEEFKKAFKTLNNFLNQRNIESKILTGLQLVLLSKMSTVKDKIIAQPIENY
tara:strand:- start:10044 stop:11228 length:1185 start_codon:yes stop_codon:yes gene_type:complete